MPRGRRRNMGSQCNLFSSRPCSEFWTQAMRVRSLSKSNPSASEMQKNEKKGGGMDRINPPFMRSFSLVLASCGCPCLEDLWW